MPTTIAMWPRLSHAATELMSALMPMAPGQFRASPTMMQARSSVFIGRLPERPAHPLVAEHLEVDEVDDLAGDRVLLLAGPGADMVEPQPAIAEDRRDVAGIDHAIEALDAAMRKE